MDAKIIKQPCNVCQEDVTFDLNVDPYSTQITIVNGKKTEERLFAKECPHCQMPTIYMSKNQEEWGSRTDRKLKAFMFSSVFSCLFMLIIIAAVGYFAVQGIFTIFDWIF